MHKQACKSGRLAAVAAMTVAFGLSLMGAAPASAAPEGVVESLDKNARIVLTGAQEDHQYRAVRVGTYGRATVDAAGNLTNLEVGTVDDEVVKKAVDGAFTAARAKNDLPDDPVAEAAFADDPIGRIATEWLGFHDGKVTTNRDETSNMESAGFAGPLRDFVTELTHDADFQDLVVKSPFISEKETDKVIIRGALDGATPVKGKIPMPEGLYIVEDTTGLERGTDVTSNSIPMLVGTWVGARHNRFLNNDEHSAMPTLGEVRVKRSSVNLSKRLVKDQERGASASIGDYLKYQIDTQVPLTTGYEGFTFKITDTAGRGLDFINRSRSEDPAHGYLVQTSRDGEEWTDLRNGDGQTVYTVTTNSSQADRGQTLTVFDFIGIQKMTYQTRIRITYSMQVNDQAGPDNLSNVAVLRYSDDPNEDGIDPNTGETMSTSEITADGEDGQEGDARAYVYAFSLHKQDKSTGDSLTGAQFTVTRKGDQTPIVFRSQTKEGSLEAQPGSYRKSVDQSEIKADEKGRTTVLTVSDAAGSKGILHLAGLGSGVYTITEVKAPDGYSEAFKPSFEVTIAPTRTQVAGREVVDASKPLIGNASDDWDLVPASGATALTEKSLIDVNNVHTVTQLPMTGGAGIALALLVSLLLMISAGLLIVVKSKRATAGA